jgi:single-stranded-DNA-specific exonuclease
MAIWKAKADLNVLREKPEANTSGFPHLIGQLLAARGVDESKLDSILNPKLSSLKDPNTIFDMDKATERLVRAFKNNEKICIYADFDLDGTSGLAILKDGFEKLGFQSVSFYQPKRLSEGYGFHAHAVEELHALGITLIVTVDVGITSFAAFQKARELGVDAILTDHHLPISEIADGSAIEKLPDAYCLVNPNQKRCSSGLGYLCGAGVGFYLIRSLKRVFLNDPELPKNEWDLKSLLDLFCIGTLTDMVPLVDDNRVLVKHGMIALQNTIRPGLRVLLEKLDLADRPLTSQDIAIRFAPKLNALSRMESEILPIHIYIEKSMSRARELVDQMMKNNLTRQTLQSSAENKALALISDWKNKDFVFVVSDEFHRGIIGLIATKLANDLNCPAFVGSLNAEGMVVGSSRLPNGFDGNLVVALKSAENLLTRFGGHAAAAGFEFAAVNEKHVVDKLTDYFFETKKNPKPLEIEFDAIANLSEVNSNMMKWHDHLGPYGMGFSIPVFRFNSLKLSKLKELKGGHLKLSFQSGSDQIDALYFSPVESKKKDIVEGLNYDVLGELQINYFNRNQTIQLLLRDFIAL